MTPWLREQLLTYKASLGDVAPENPVFPTRDAIVPRQGQPQPPRDRAGRSGRQQRCASERGLAPLPTGLSAHVFRRTYITLMAEAGAPITYVQDQVGHESARLTLEIYARVSRSRDRAKWGRAFDEIMAGAVPADAYTPASPIALPVIDDDTGSVPGVRHDSGSR